MTDQQSLPEAEPSPLLPVLASTEVRTPDGGTVTLVHAPGAEVPPVIDPGCVPGCWMCAS